MNIIRVASQSEASLVAGAVAGVIREHQEAVLQAVGANAVNQAVKAIVIARSYLAEDGIDLYVIPEFTSVELGGEMRTAVRFFVYVRPSIAIHLQSSDMALVG